MARKILAKFQARLGREVAEIEMALTGGDLVKAAQVAHQLKGAAGNLAAGVLYTITVEFESLAKQGDERVALACFDRLRSEANRFSSWVPETVDGQNALPQLAAAVLERS